MSQDPFHPESAADPQDGAAVIPQVTSEMMDEAAHRAAGLADGVAHHTAPSGSSVYDASGQAIEAVDEGQTIEPAAVETIARSSEAAEAVVGSVGQSFAEAADAAQAVLPEAGHLATRATDPASAWPADGADAFGRYNAKVFEMVRSNMASTTALFAALIQAKSVPEAVALNADHLRHQVETLASQGRELASLAQTLALGALQPRTRRDH